MHIKILHCSLEPHKRAKRPLTSRRHLQGPLKLKCSPLLQLPWERNSLPQTLSLRPTSVWHVLPGSTPFYGACPSFEPLHLAVSNLCKLRVTLDHCQIQSQMIEFCGDVTPPWVLASFWVKNKLSCPPTKNSFSFY